MNREKKSELRIFKHFHKAKLLSEFFAVTSILNLDKKYFSASLVRAFHFFFLLVIRDAKLDRKQEIAEPWRSRSQREN